MKKDILSCLLLLLASGASAVFAQPSAAADAYFLDWGKRLNQAWFQGDTTALGELLPPGIFMTISWEGGMEEVKKKEFIRRVQEGNELEFKGLFWGKTTPFFSADTLAVRCSQDEGTVWLLQNHYYKEQWKISGKLVQDSGIISMQTTFQPLAGKWQPAAAFINFLRLKTTNNWGCLTKWMDIKSYRGKPFRLEAAVRLDAAGENGFAQLWARVARETGDMGFFDNMGDSPITGKDWAIYKIEGRLDEDADSLGFGGCLGEVPGTAWFDNFQLQVEESPGKWKTLPLQNSDFETPSPTEKHPAGWRGNYVRFTNFSGACSSDAPFQGKYSFRLTGTAER